MGEWYSRLVELTALKDWQHNAPEDYERADSVVANCIAGVMCQGAMKKRDRVIRIMYHRRTQQYLLFPYVCYMAGVAAACGDAFLLAGDNLPSIGKTIASMLRKCEKADVEGLANLGRDALRRHWKGETVSTTDLHPTFNTNDNWHLYHTLFPVLRQGPAKYLASFSAAELVARETSKSLLLTQLTRSSHAGCETDGETVRIPSATPSSQLCRIIRAHLEAW